MKATLTLEFDLPEDMHEFNLHTHATKLSVALWEVRQMLHGLWKHANLEGKTADELIDDIWREFNDIAGNVMEVVE